MAGILLQGIKTMKNYTQTEIINHPHTSKIIKSLGIAGKLTSNNFDEISNSDLERIKSQLSYYDNSSSFEQIVKFVSSKTESTARGKTFFGKTKSGEEFNIWTDMSGNGAFKVDGKNMTSNINLIEQDLNE